MSDGNKKPGRVYGLETGSPGVRSGMGYRFFTHTGEKVQKVSRVAFDADADEGMATVTAIVCTQQGGALFDPQAGTVCAVTFRTWVRAVAKGQPDPPLTPDAVLWKSDVGTIRLEHDPLPDEALEAINRAGQLVGAGA